MVDSKDHKESQAVPPFSTAPARPEPPTPQGALLDAVLAKYIADRAAAVANLNNYLVNSVGVGEHPDIVAEACRLFEGIDKADSMIETIKRVMNIQ